MGRKTSVPHILMAPHTEPDLLLNIALSQMWEAAKNACSSSDQSVAKLVAEDFQPIEVVKNSFPGLFDELSAHSYTGRPIQIDRARDKALMEFRALRHVERRGLQNALLNDDAFLDLVFCIHRAVKGGGTQIRRGHMIIRPDEGGNLIIFPPWQLCDRLLRALAGLLRDYMAICPALCPVIAYVGIIHAHPFRDANGRTARLLFNLLLRHVAGSSHYLPVSKIELISDGGFLIKLRRALYGGEWEALTRFFADALTLSHKIQKNK